MILTIFNLNISFSLIRFSVQLIIFLLYELFDFDKNETENIINNGKIYSCWKQKLVFEAIEQWSMTSSSDVTFVSAKIFTNHFRFMLSQFEKKRVWRIVLFTRCEWVIMIVIHFKCQGNCVLVSIHIICLSMWVCVCFIFHVVKLMCIILYPHFCFHLTQNTPIVQVKAIKLILIKWNLTIAGNVPMNTTCKIIAIRMEFMPFPMSEFNQSLTIEHLSIVVAVITLRK